MTNDHKKIIQKTWEKKKKKKKKYFLCVSFVCSEGFPVSDPDDAEEEAPEELRPTRSSGSKRNSCSWFSWPKYKKKTKTMLAGEPEAAANHHRILPAAENGLPEDYLSEGSFRVNRTNGTESGHHDPYDNRSRELELPTPPLRISVKNNRTSTPSSSTASSFRMFIRTSKPTTPRGRAATRSSIASHAGAGGDDVVHTINSTVANCAGLWIMVATLAVMLLSGRATAVICLLSFMYLVPRSRPPAEAAPARSEQRDVDTDSGEYKKRVVLEGLLERNGRRPSSGPSQR